MEWTMEKQIHTDSPMILINEQKQCNGEKIVFQQMVLEKLDIHMQKKKKKKKRIQTLYPPLMNLNSMYITDLTVKYKSIKLFHNNTGENLDALGLGDSFLDVMTKVQSMNKTVDK